jgi:peptidoglycan/LPS O-acetylase OafA/YrhL
MTAHAGVLNDGPAGSTRVSALSTPTRHYPALDGLRGIAALAVVGYHVALYFKLPYAPAHAYLAVDFFFMLSGYVIAHAYDTRLNRNMGLTAFLIIRLVRLYPLVVLGVGIGTIALLVGVNIVPGLTILGVLQAAAANIFLLPATSLLNIRPLAFPTDSPLWSLAFEIWINVLYAATFRRLTRPVLIVSLLAGAALTSWASLRYGSLNIGFTVAEFYLGSVRVLFPFVAGILLSRLGSVRRGSCVWCQFAAIPLIAAFAGPDLSSGAYDAAAVIILFPMVVAAAAASSPAPWLDKIWGFLGAVSYPLYVLHFPFVVVLSNLTHRRHITGIGLYAAAGVTMLLTITIAIAALYLYDQPVRRLLYRRLGRPAPA